MKVIQTEIPGVVIIEPKVFGDARGWFMESWQVERYAGVGVPERMVQDNQAYSGHGILRGLHVQWPYPQGKLVQVLSGECEFTLAGEVRALKAGDWLSMPPNLSHAVSATTRFAMLLTLVKP